VSVTTGRPAASVSPALLLAVTTASIGLRTSRSSTPRARAFHAACASFGVPVGMDAPCEAALQHLQALAAARSARVHHRRVLSCPDVTRHRTPSNSVATRRASSSIDEIRARLLACARARDLCGR